MQNLFGLNNVIQLRDQVKAVKPNSLGDMDAEIWSIVDNFIGELNKACYNNTLTAALDSEGVMETSAELYRICAHIWSDEDDLASDAYEYSVKKLDELVEYHQEMSDLYNSTGSTVIK